MSNQDDLAVLARHGRSFRLAGRLLGPVTLDRAARLYAACRAIDDLADESPDPVLAGEVLRSLRADLLAGRGATPLGRRLLSLEVDPDAAAALVDAMLADLEPVHVADEAALLRYAYGAAGTVGLMMCDVLGVIDPAARPHAVDLGIAMQLTNIARDVREDALRGRLYLPGSWLPPGTTAATVLDNQAAAFVAVQRLLGLAERHYRSGALGYAALPGRSAVAIPAAARLYREIGIRILRRGPAYLHRGRCVVPPIRRLALIAASVLQHRVRLKPGPGEACRGTPDGEGAWQYRLAWMLSDRTAAIVPEPR